MTSPAALVARLAALIGVLLSGVAAFVPVTAQTFTGSDDREPFVLVTYWWALVTRFAGDVEGGEVVLRVVVFVLIGGVLAALVIPHLLLLAGSPTPPRAPRPADGLRRRGALRGGLRPRDQAARLLALRRPGRPQRRPRWSADQTRGSAVGQAGRPTARR